MNKQEIIDKLIEEKVFWSYDFKREDPISDEVLIEKTLIYLDLDEINALFELFPYEKIKEVWLQKVKSQEPRLYNLNLFLGKWYFNK
ncbi:MAG: hypothetical protein ACNS62_14105 [Candidatus Cyclobacteriaceae bacterium M3_2C_046]